MTKIALSETLAVTVGGESRDLFMSFGLLNELIDIIKDIPELAQVAVNGELRIPVLNSVLAERDATGKILTPINPFTLNISSSDVIAICGWVVAHVLDFFLAALELTLETHGQRMDELNKTGNSPPS